MPADNPEHFDPAVTALLVVDPYNDFLSEGGKLYGRCEAVIRQVDCVTHMKQVLAAARTGGVRVFITPHHRWCEQDYEGWRTITPSQRGTSKMKLFAEGSWGGTFHPDFQPQPGDIVAQQHWLSSGFANTDLDLQLKRHGIQKVIIMGLRANTCIDSTMRFAAELGYEVTLVSDAIAAFSMDEMRATLELNAPSYATAVLPTAEIVARLTGGGAGS